LYVLIIGAYEQAYGHCPYGYGYEFVEAVANDFYFLHSSCESLWDTLTLKAKQPTTQRLSH